MFAVTDRVTIAAPDEPCDAEIVVRLHPVGTRAKGWGHEPETRAAIRWLEAHVQPGMTVADIGTGTGILAIVAALLGAAVTAYEENPDIARVIAWENFILNKVEPNLQFDYDGTDGFDLVVANLGDVDYQGMGILDAGREVWTSG